MIIPSYYKKGRDGETYEEPNTTGFTTLEVLKFLYGRKWDEVALGFVHSLRPSYIRVSEGEVLLNAKLWRVTVIVDKNDVIKEITQEVEVGWPANFIVSKDTKEDFIKRFCLDSEISLDCIREWGLEIPLTGKSNGHSMIAKPCNCCAKDCGGWIME